MDKSALDIQVELYPQVLRRLAAGERLASMKDELEKVGAVALVVEALEKEAEAQPSNGHTNEATKEAVDPISLVLGGAAGAALKGPIGRGIAKLRGKPVIPAESEEIFRLMRRTIEEEEKTRAARAKMLGAGVVGAGLGALATKALTKEQPKAAAEAAPEKPAEKKAEEKKEGQFAQDHPLEVFDTTSPDVPPATEKITAPAKPVITTEAKQARAVLDRIMKNFQ